MSTDEERRRYAEKIGREWADKGKLVEGGWRTLRSFMLRDMSHDTDEKFERAARKLFFLGAEHVFTTIVAIMEPGAEPTEADMRRMSQIHAELEAFKLEFASRHETPGHA